MRRTYFNQEVCIGCRLCEVYCRLQHSGSRDLIKAFKTEPRPPLPRLRLEKTEAVSFAVRCLHCDDSPCVYACLTGALQRNPDSGIVEVDNDKCIGCWTCILVCPVGAIRQDAEHKKVLKCDLCHGEEVPACVANCPNEAMICPEMREGDSDRGSQRIGQLQ